MNITRSKHCNNKYVESIKFCVAISLLGLFISKFLPINVSILPWTTSLLSLLTLSVCFGKTCRRDILMLGFISIFAQVISVISFNTHLFDNVNTLGTNANLISWLLYILILSSVATGYHHITKAELNEIIRFIFNGAFVAGIIVFLMDFDKLSSILSGKFSTYTMAMWGFFPNKNMFGMICTLGIISGIYVIFTEKHVKTTILKCAFLLIMLILSFCRTAWLFLIVFLITFFLQNFYLKNQKSKKISRKLFWAFIFAILIGLIVIMRDAGLRQVIETNFLRLDTGDAGRGNIQQALLTEIRQKGLFAHLFGIGYSEYSFLCSIDVHSVYIYTFVTGGIVKTFALLLLVIFTVLTNKRCNNVLVRHYGIGVLLSFLTISFFETYEPFEVGLLNMIIFSYILLFPMLQGKGDMDYSVISVKDNNEK